MKGDQKIINELTSITNEKKLAQIEEILRMAQFAKGAREAVEFLEVLGKGDLCNADVTLNWIMSKAGQLSFTALSMPKPRRCWRR